MNMPVWGAVAAALVFLFVRSKEFVYFLFSNPDSLSFATFYGFAGYAADFFFAAFMFGGFLHWGRKIVRIFRLPMERTEESLFALAVGEACAAFLILLLGFLGLYKTALLPALYCSLLFGAYREREEGERALRAAARLLGEKVSIPELCCAFVIAAALLRAAILSAAPPTDWDSLAYHLAFPKLYLMEGKFYRLSWSMNGHYPMNSEMIYLLALSFKRELACHWINFFHGIFVLALVAGLARRIFCGQDARITGWLAAAIFAAQPVFDRVIGNAATDLNVTFISLLAVGAFFHALNSEEYLRSRWTLLCGVLVGVAMSSKLTGTWLALTLFLQIAFFYLLKPPRDWKSAAIFLIGIACTGLPWYLKNWFWTGNPIWPYLGELFGSSGLDVESWRRMHRAVTEGVPKTFLNFILIPVILIFKGELFHYATEYLALPFFVLTLHPAVWKNWTKAEKTALAFFATYLSIWYWVYHDWRYFMPASGVMAAIIAGWLVRIVNNSGRRGLWHSSVAAIICFLPLKSVTVNNELFVLFSLKSKSTRGLTPKDRYLLGALGPVYPVTEFANKTLPPDAKVLFFRDVRGYYLDRRYVWGDPLNPGLFSYAAVENADALRVKLSELGFTHVLYNPYIGNYKGDQSYYSKADGLVTEMLRRYGVKRAEFEGVALYEIAAG